MYIYIYNTISYIIPYLIVTILIYIILIINSHDIV